MNQHVRKIIDKIPYKDKLKNNKPMVFMLLGLAFLFLIIFGIKTVKGFLFYRAMMSHSTAIAVSAMPVKFESWSNEIKASASVRAVRGIDVTTEVAGIVRTIEFTPGMRVKKGDLIVELNANSEIAQLHALEAAAELARSVYERDKEQYNIKAISKAVLDSDSANLKARDADVEAQKATISKKRIVAPFDGRLGISLVNPGQYLSPGDKIVTLQALDPIYIDFYVPQQTLTKLKKGQAAAFTTNAFPNLKFYGQVTTLNPKAELETRNVQIEATVSNPDFNLLPGMFGMIQVVVGKERRFLTLPQTAISFNPYGELVYVVHEKGKEKENNDKEKNGKKTNGKKENIKEKNKKGKSSLYVKQKFVKVGERRGDQIAILEGLEEGDQVVVSGQFKLKNDAEVVINNSVLPENNPNAKPVEE